jgi:hypothetical protein
MIKLFIVCLLILLIQNKLRADDRIKIGIIDSGISNIQSHSKILCKDGLKSVIHDDGIDTNGHGTNIFGLVSENLDSKIYCIISYKVYGNKDASYDEIIAALNQAHHAGVKYLNISMVGKDPSEQEEFLLKVMVHNKVYVNVAVGNNGKNLNFKCNAYPACYRLDKKYFSPIGAYDGNYSNFGSIVKKYEYGKDLGSPVLTGTSQATAVFTNKQILSHYKSMVIYLGGTDARTNYKRAKNGHKR